jgi:hypothetical protein
MVAMNSGGTVGKRGSKGTIVERESKGTVGKRGSGGMIARRDSRECLATSTRAIYHQREVGAKKGNDG